MSLRNHSRLVDVVEAALDEVPTADPAMRRAQLATIAEARALNRVVSAIRDQSALLAETLPADLADVEPDTRARLDAVAARHRITPSAALALIRSGQRARAEAGRLTRP